MRPALLFHTTDQRDDGRLCETSYDAVRDIGSPRYLLHRCKRLRSSRVLACVPACMARQVGAEIYFRIDQLDEIDDRVENRSEYIRELVDADLGLEAEA
jgi:hypothetical protein